MTNGLYLASPQYTASQMYNICDLHSCGPVDLNIMHKWIEPEGAQEGRVNYLPLQLVKLCTFYILHE